MQYQVNLTGISFRVAENKALEQEQPRGECEIRLDPANPYAKHSRGSFEVWWQGNHLGFLPDRERGMLDDIVRALDAGDNVQCEAVDYSRLDGDEWTGKDGVGVLGSVTVSIHTPSAAPAPGERPAEDFVLLDSFNEAGVQVQFYEQAHQYHYDNRRLKSVTGVVSRIYPPFDAATISERCAKSWKMPAEAIRAMWSAQGDATSSFGSCVHTLIESYERWGERALPKMKALRDIVESFPWAHTKGLTVHPEALVTCVKRDLTGLADRLVEKDGTITVADLKLQHSATATSSSCKCSLMPELPASKIGKAACQMSLYGGMLEESGLTVSDKVVVYVWDGGWTYHAVDRVKDALDRVAEKMGITKEVMA